MTTLDRLDELLRACTPGPWSPEGIPLVTLEGFETGGHAGFIERADAVFIAALRNAAADLIAVAREARLALLATERYFARGPGWVAEGSRLSTELLPALCAALVKLEGGTL